MTAVVVPPLFGALQALSTVEARDQSSLSCKSESGGSS